MKLDLFGCFNVGREFGVCFINVYELKVRIKKGKKEGKGGR